MQDDPTQQSYIGSESKAKSGAKYERSSVPHLHRHLASGIYYARARGTNSRDTWKSLGTDVFSVAKARVGQEVLKIQAGVGAKHKQTGMARIVTVGDAAVLYQARVEADTSLKPSSIVYRTKTIEGLFRFWPNLKECKIT